MGIREAVERRWAPVVAPPVVAVAAAAVLVAGCAAAGWWLTAGGARLHLGNTFPVTGRYQAHLSGWLVAPVAVAAAVWFAGRRLAARLPWPALLAAGYLVAVAWAVALAVVAGPAALPEPLTTRWEYLAEVARIDAMGLPTYLATFTDHILAGPAGAGWTNHVTGHPPLLTLLFVLLARAGLGGAGPAAGLCVAAGAAAVPAVLSTARRLAGEDWARRAAPFVATAPVALWVATSADAIIAGVAAAGVAILAHAAARTGPAAVGLATAAGAVLGATLLLSYGMVLLAPVALAVALALRAGDRSPAPDGRASHPVAVLPPVLAACAGAAAVLAAAAAAGFWWWEGLVLTAERVRVGEGWSQRPAGYFWFANPAALAVAVGPAVVAALALLRRAWWAPGSRRLAAPAAGALVAVALATASTLSKGEVERIWLPFAVWLLPLAALLPGARSGDPPARGWLAAHLGWPVLVAAGTTLSW